MRNSVAKRLREEVYGGLSRRQKDYSVLRTVKRFLQGDGRVVQKTTGQIVNSEGSFRALYLKAKEVYKMNRPQKKLVKLMEHPTLSEQVHDRLKRQKGRLVSKLRLVETLLAKPLRKEVV